MELRVARSSITCSCLKSSLAKASDLAVDLGMQKYADPPVAIGQVAVRPAARQLDVGLLDGGVHRGVDLVLDHNVVEDVTHVSVQAGGDTSQIVLVAHRLGL